MKAMRYETRLITLLAFTWGFVFLDRVVITYLFPILSAQFGFSAAEIGAINMVTSLGYIGASIVVSILADRSGWRKRWLVPLVVLAAVFSGASAFAASFTAFMILRFLVGTSEGPVFPLISSIVSAQTEPDRFAMSIGVISLVATALTTVVGPIVVTQIAVALGWQAAFVLTSLPTLLLGLLVWRMVREVDPATVGRRADAQRIRAGDLTRVLAYRNVVVCLVLVSLVMLSLWSVAVYMPLYLTRVSQMSTSQMGLTMAAYGAAGVLWALVIPAVSNRIGRKRATIGFLLLASIPFFALHFLGGEASLALFVLLASILTFMPLMFFGIISSETVPASVAATASALIMGVGELFGAALAPGLLGAVADAFGLSTIYLVAGVSMLLASAVGLALVETHPRLAAGRRSEAIHATPAGSAAGRSARP